MSLKEFSADSGTALADQAEQPGDEFMVLDLALIVASSHNPRTIFNVPRLQELADSIRASGVHQPVLVRPLPAKRLQETFDGFRRGERPAYELIAGERRFRASKLAGVDTIPAMVRHLTDEQVLEIQLVENLQRDDLHPMEEAEGYERLIEATRITKEQVGEKIGKSRGYVYGRLKLLDLCQDARSAFYEGHIDSSRALVIARIPDAKLQLKALEEARALDYQGGLRHNFKDFTRWAQQNMMLRLDAARFKITDESLVPEAGNCKECSKRTGAQPEVFADVDSADVCIDPACFHAKEAAHEAIVIAEAEAKGQRIIPEREAKELWRWEHSKIDGYVRADRPDDRVGGSKMLKTILGKDAPDPILMQNPHKDGELIEVYPADKVTKLLKDKGRITPRQARSDRPISAQEAARDALAKFEKTWRKRAIAAVQAEFANQVADNGSISGFVCKAIAMELLSGLRGDERQHTCELLGLGKVADREAIESHLLGATPIECEQTMLLLLMQHDMLQLVSYSNGKAIPATRIEAVAENYAVPLEPIQKAVKDEMAEAAKPKVKAPKAEEPAPAPAKTKGGKKSSLPPAAQALRARKPSKEEVQLDIALAFQAIDQAPDGAGQGGAAEAAQGQDQAPVGADEEEGAAPAALAPTFKLGDLAKIKAGSKSAGGKALKTIGKVGRVIGLGDDGRVHLRHGPRSHELVVVQLDQIEHYTADPLIGSKVRVLSTGEFQWKSGAVTGLRDDGWLIDFDDGEPVGGFTSEELEVMAWLKRADPATVA